MSTSPSFVPSPRWAAAWATALVTVALAFSVCGDRDTPRAEWCACDGAPSASAPLKMRSRPVPPDLIVRPLELSPHRVATVWSITHDPAYFADKVVAVRTTGFFVRGRWREPHLLFHTAVEARVWLEKARLQLAWLSPETLVLEAQDQATDRQLEAFDGEYVTVTGRVRTRGPGLPPGTMDGVDTSASPILEVTSFTRADAPPIASAWASGVDTPPPSASSAR